MLENEGIDTILSELWLHVYFKVQTYQRIIFSSLYIYSILKSDIHVCTEWSYICSYTSSGNNLD